MAANIIFQLFIIGMMNGAIIFSAVSKISFQSS